MNGSWFSEYNAASPCSYEAVITNKYPYAKTPCELWRLKHSRVIVFCPSCWRMGPDFLFSVILLGQPVDQQLQLPPALHSSTHTTIANDAAAPPTFDVSMFKSYLLSLLPPILGTSSEELFSLFDDEFEERVTQFTADGGGMIYIIKIKEIQKDAPPQYYYQLASQLTYSPSNAMALALIKCGHALDPLAPLATQLHILNLFGGEETPYESLHAVVSCGVKPWFDAFVGARGTGKEGDTKMGIPMTKKKFAELELSLLHLQQNVEIPETHLIIHPVIQWATEQVITFLNNLHSHVNQWIKSIQAVTKLSRDALEGIEAQLRSEEVNMVMDFITDTGLNSAMDLVHKYNQLMKDFPLNELLSATDLDKIQESLVLIFGHINHKLKLSLYPIHRALPLVEAISQDFNDQLLCILTSHRLPYAPYKTFNWLLPQTLNIFWTWDDLIKEPIKAVPAHAKLQEQQHEQLAVMTRAIKGLMTLAKEVRGMDMEEEVKEAYEVIKCIDVLDVSVEGMEIWVATENAYNERAARVENQIIAWLCDRLGMAHNANEMFRVFSKFNALFVWPKIRGAIQEYQTQLIDSVKEDIKRLHGKFKTQYHFSEAYHMSQMRDLLPITGAIIWALQIEWQLLAYMKRVEDVLGKGWELYAEGQKLQSESAAFRKKLDRDMAIDGCLFEIVRLCRGGFQLVVNFDPQMITFLHMITNMAKDTKWVYPHAVSLMEAVRTYSQMLGLWLVAEYRNDAQRMVAKGMNICWDHFVNHYDTARFVSSADGWDNRHIQFVREFASVVSVLQDKTNNMTGLEAFSELLSKIQAVIDRLNLEGHTDANLEHWVAELNKRIEGILLQRLAHIIQVWCSEFDRTIDEEEPPMISLYTKSDASATVELPMVVSAFLSSVSAIIATTLPNYILATPSCTYSHSHPCLTHHEHQWDGPSSRPVRIVQNHQVLTSHFTDECFCSPQGL
ncbi:cytoplasmic dynein heavy chain 1 [Pisolithus thermaeus]|nr:cytoplasmic dynein heavy chain 1 [Pisolithus thermaeus]